jgi:hypothetical protein
MILEAFVPLSNRPSVFVVAISLLSRKASKNKAVVVPIN